MRRYTSDPRVGEIMMLPQRGQRRGGEAARRWRGLRRKNRNLRPGLGVCCSGSGLWLVDGCGGTAGAEHERLHERMSV